MYRHRFYSCLFVTGIVTEKETIWEGKNEMETKTEMETELEIEKETETETKGEAEMEMETKTETETLTILLSALQTRVIYIETNRTYNVPLFREHI